MRAAKRLSSEEIETVNRIQVLDKAAFLFVRMP